MCGYAYAAMSKEKEAGIGRETVFKCSLEDFLPQYFSIIETIVTTVAI